MNFKRLCILFFAVITLAVLCACGEKEPLTKIIISGTIDGDAIDIYSDKPVMIAVTGTSDFDKIATDPLGTVVKFVSADKVNRSFSIDLFGTGLSAGDEVYILAFIDKTYSGGTPYPDAGDIVGFYIDPKNLSPALKLETGENSGVSISITREIFSFEASISGTILGNETGDLTIVAYAGEINSSDFTDLDTDAIIGFKQYTKEEDPLVYNMAILPYGFNIPIENVFIFALLDVNRNQNLDSGDRIGYFSAEENSLPSPVTIEEGTLQEMDINFYMDVHTRTDDTEAPAEFDQLMISGVFSLPAEYDENEGSVFIVTVDPSYFESFGNNPVSKIRYFKKIPPGESSFDIDLINTGLLPEEKIALIGIWDKNYEAGFPDPDPGDFIGFYVNDDTFSTSYTLKTNGNTGIAININRKVFDFSAKVKGTVSGSQNGDILLIAYAGEINSLDFTALNFDSIIGFKTISETSSSIGYTLPIFPYGFNIPIENVYIIALIDNNGNSVPDAGDSIGFHTNPQGQLPQLVDINEGSQSGIDIEILFEIPFPSGYDITIQGIIDPPADYFSSSQPVFIMVAGAGNLDEIFTNPLSSIHYFTKLLTGKNSFELNLSGTSLTPEDDIMIIALWDRDYEAGFPDTSQGDMAGFYQNKRDFRSNIILSEIKGSIPSGNWEFIIDRNIIHHDASVSFSLEEGGGVILNTNDQVIMIAVHKDGVDDTWPNIFTPATYVITDMDYVIGMQTIMVNGANEYSLNIIPAIYDGITIPDDGFAINDVYIFAILDANLNGRPDEGENVGFYWQQFLFVYLPDMIDISEGTNILDKSVKFSAMTY